MKKEKKKKREKREKKEKREKREKKKTKKQKQKETHHVDFDTNSDSLLLQDINKRDTLLGLVVERLLKQDTTRDVFLQPLSGNKELTVGTPVLFVVLDRDTIETLANGASTLVSSQNTLSGGGNVVLLGGMRSREKGEKNGNERGEKRGVRGGSKGERESRKKGGKERRKNRGSDQLITEVRHFQSLFFRSQRKTKKKNQTKTPGRQHFSES